MKPFNGHRSWNAWNVALWINNDKELYEVIYPLAIAHIPTQWIIKYILSKKRGDISTTHVVKDILGTKTPDGAVYNRLSLKLAIEGIRQTF